MRRNPKVALDFFNPRKKTYDELQDITENCFPEEFTAEGEAEVSMQMILKISGVLQKYALITQIKKKYILHLPILKDNIDIKDKIVFNTSIYLNNEALAKDYKITGQPGNPPVLGPQSVVAILVHVTVVDNVIGESERILTAPILRKSEVRMCSMVISMIILYKFIMEKWRLPARKIIRGSIADVYGPYTITLTVDKHYCSLIYRES